MKSSTARKTKKNETPRVLTRKELNALSLHVSLRDVWVVREHSGILISTHRTQAEAIEKGRALAKKRNGQLAIHDRKGNVRRWEVFWTRPIVLKSSPIPPEFRPVNATRKEMREAMKAVVRKRRALEAQQAR